MKRSGSVAFKEGFPFYSIDPRHRASLRNRWFVFARWSVVRSLEGWYARLSDEVDSECSLVSLLRLQDANMLVAAMRSLSLVRRTLPPVRVVCDRDEDVAALRGKLERHLGGVVVEGPRDVGRDLLERGENVLAELTKRHVFWLKFAAVVLATERRQTIYSDADILFFRDPEQLASGEAEPHCRIAQDYQFSYSKWLVDALRVHRGRDLCAERPGNAGFGIYRRGFAKTIDREVLERCLERPAAELFDEQTFTAYTALTSGELLPRSDVYVDAVPVTSWRGSWRRRPWALRHYIGPIREQFWIDAWQLLGVRGLK